MLIKKITYTDYNGEERTEEFYFSLNKAELLRMNMSKRGGMEEYLKRMIDENDPEKLTSMFEELILSGYGIKSEDGKKFMKSKELSEDFKNTAAYAELFFELASDTNAITNFLIGMLPADLATEVSKMDLKSLPST